MKRNNCHHKERKRGEREKRKRSMEERDRVLWEEGACSCRRDVQRSAKYAYLFSMPLMGHISLGALCLLPNYKRYLALHLQEIPHNKDNIGIWSLCWICSMLSSAVKTHIVLMQLEKNKPDYSRGYIWLLFLHGNDKRMRLIRISLNLSATVFCSGRDSTQMLSILCVWIRLRCVCRVCAYVCLLCTLRFDLLI